MARAWDGIYMKQKQLEIVGHKDMGVLLPYYVYLYVDIYRLRIYIYIYII